jgi:hypothetical protein
MYSPCEAVNLPLTGGIDNFPAIQVIHAPEILQVIGDDLVLEVCPDALVVCSLVSFSASCQHLRALGVKSSYYLWKLPGMHQSVSCGNAQPLKILQMRFDLP